MALVGPSLVIVALALARLSAAIVERKVSLRAVDGWLPLSGLWLRHSIGIALGLVGALLFFAGALITLGQILLLIGPWFDQTNAF